MNTYISNHVVPDEFWLLKWVILDLRQFINRIQWICVSNCGEFVQFGSRPCNVIDQHVKLWSADVVRYEDFGRWFVDIIITIVKCLTRFDRFFDELGTCPWNVVYFHGISHGCFRSDIFLRLQSGKVHGLKGLLVREIGLVHDELEY